MTSRTLVTLAIVGAAVVLAAVVGIVVRDGGRTPAPTGPMVTVYRQAGCDCCLRWVEHLRRAGLRVTVQDGPDTEAIRATYKVPTALQSCHTAIVDGYVVEGHVPVDLITRLLQERPAVRGIAVPGMPIGSPGMEGNRVEHYDVMTFDTEGRTTVFAER